MMMRLLSLAAAGLLARRIIEENRQRPVALLTKAGSGPAGKRKNAGASARSRATPRRQDRG